MQPRDCRPQCTLEGEKHTPEYEGHRPQQIERMGAPAHGGCTTTLTGIGKYKEEVSMLTGIGSVVMQVAEFAACRTLYGTDLGLVEIGCGVGADGHQVCMFAVGSSILEIHEKPSRTNAGNSHPESASVGHFALLVASIDEAYAMLRERNVLGTRTPVVQPLDHSYMQRSLLQFDDPNGFVVQISEVVDPRDHVQERRAAKIAFGASDSPRELFQGFCHFHMPSMDIHASREFYGQKLGLEEISHRIVPDSGAEESVFAVGCTDLEIWMNPDVRTLQPSTVSRLGFWTDDVDYAYQVLKDRGVALDTLTTESAPSPHIRRRAFTFRDPEGRSLQIAQRIA